ncbi:peptidoglycan editing factor PgeF [Pontibacillus salipaludis]|uniref:peptidoglycan editing factor PgeF n=1 Tax=Pontibacillus salipaludis TaxID=1697394 RepID=UPI0031E5305B
MESFHHTHPSYMELTKWTYPHPELTVGLTTRIGGTGEPPFDSFNLAWHVPDQQDTIRRNRETLAQLLDFPLESWVGGEQVHKTEIKRVTKKDLGKGATSRETAIPDCDGLITNEPNLLLTAFYADCVPLFFFDPVNNWIGIAHAGWRGTVASMGPKMIDALEKHGADKRHIRVAVGPSIGGDAYEVDDAVVDQIPNQFRSEPTVIEQGSGKYLLSLQQMHKELLMQAGIKEDHIEVSEYCTYQNSHLFFSHRRDEGKTGRMLGFIGFKK